MAGGCKISSYSHIICLILTEEFVSWFEKKNLRSHFYTWLKNYILRSYFTGFNKINQMAVGLEKRKKEIERVVFLVKLFLFKKKFFFT